MTPKRTLRREMHLRSTNKSYTLTLQIGLSYHPHSTTSNCGRP